MIHHTDSPSTTAVPPPSPFPGPLVTPRRLRPEQHLLLALALVLALFSAPAADAASSRRPPNVVFILTDNHGAWTLGCYGNPDIRTPHIDRLAAQGAIMTRALSSNPVCSPTRATYLTGLMPSQHGVHSFLDHKYEMGPQAYSAVAEFRSLPEILADAGYVCGLTGKWHLGNSLIPQEGFTSWVTQPGGGTSEFYNREVIENGEVRIEKGYLTDFWTDRGIRFMEENKDRPFFLYLAYNGPYALSPLLLNRAQNRHAEYYADKHLPSFPRDSMHPWQHANKAYHNNIESYRRVAAEVSGVDDGVGEILAAIDRLGLEQDTLVIFAGDQGWMGGQNGLFGMGDHTRPISAFELMMQIPFIVRYPGRIPAGMSSDIIVSNYDFLPTVLGLLEMDDRVPEQPRSPGRDFSPILRGENAPWENVMYYEMEYTRAIRGERWKYVARSDDSYGPGELYDMQNDPHERINLFGQPKLAPVQQEMHARLDGFFAKYADPKYDIWRGGISKATVHSDRPLR